MCDIRRGLAGTVIAGLLLLFMAQSGVRAADPGVPILVYHRFDAAKVGLTTIPTAIFEQQLDWLAAHRVRVVPLQAIVAWLHGTGPAPPLPAVGLSVDDGHVSVYTRLFPIIRRRHLPVTLFIYPSVISRASYALTWAELAEMVGSGLVTVESHTYWHPDFRLERTRRTPADYRAFVDSQLGRSKTVLEQRLGIRIDMLAWPYGIVDPELKAAARRAGYRAAFGFSGGRAAPGVDMLAIPRIPVPGWSRGDLAGLLVSGDRVRAVP